MNDQCDFCGRILPEEGSVGRRGAYCGVGCEQAAELERDMSLGALESEPTEAFVPVMSDEAWLGEVDTTAFCHP